MMFLWNLNCSVAIFDDMCYNMSTTTDVRLGSLGSPYGGAGMAKASTWVTRSRRVCKRLAAFAMPLGATWCHWWLRITFAPNPIGIPLGLVMTVMTSSNPNHEMIWNVIKQEVLVNVLSEPWGRRQLDEPSQTGLAHNWSFNQFILRINRRILNLDGSTRLVFLYPSATLPNNQKSLLCQWLRHFQYLPISTSSSVALFHSTCWKGICPIISTQHFLRLRWRRKKILGSPFSSCFHDHHLIPNPQFFWPNHWVCWFVSCCFVPVSQTLFSAKKTQQTKQKNGVLDRKVNPNPRSSDALRQKSLTDR